MLLAENNNNKKRQTFKWPLQWQAMPDGINLHYKCMIFLRNLHCGRSATFGTRNSWRISHSLSCWSKYSAMSREVVLQPSCLDTLSITSCGEPTEKGSMTAPTNSNVLVLFNFFFVQAKIKCKLAFLAKEGIGRSSNFDQFTNQSFWKNASVSDKLVIIIILFLGALIIHLTPTVLLLHFWFL